jgi:hypothetical protein
MLQPAIWSYSGGAFLLPPPPPKLEDTTMVKTVLSTYENTLCDAVHRLQEEVLYFLNITQFYGTRITIQGVPYFLNITQFYGTRITIQGIPYFLNVTQFYGTRITIQLVISGKRETKLCVYPSKFTRNLILLNRITYRSPYRILPRSDSKCGEGRA